MHDGDGHGRPARAAGTTPRDDQRPTTAGIKSEKQYTRPKGKRITQRALEARKGHSFLEWAVDIGAASPDSGVSSPRGSPSTNARRTGAPPVRTDDMRADDAQIAAQWGADNSPLTSLINASTADKQALQRLAAQQQYLREQQLLLQKQQEAADAQLAAALAASSEEARHAGPRHTDSLGDLLAATGGHIGGDRPASAASRRHSDASAHTPYVRAASEPAMVVRSPARAQGGAVASPATSAEQASHVPGAGEVARDLFDVGARQHVPVAGRRAGAAAPKAHLDETPLVRGGAVDEMPLSDLVSELEKLQETVLPAPKYGRRKLGSDNPPSLPASAYTSTPHNASTPDHAPMGAFVPKVGQVRAQNLVSATDAGAPHGGAAQASAHAVGVRRVDATPAVSAPASERGRVLTQSVNFGYSSSDDETPHGTAPPSSPGSLQDAMLAEIEHPRADMIRLLCWRTAQVQPLRCALHAPIAHWCPCCALGSRCSKHVGAGRC